MGFTGLAFYPGSMLASSIRDWWMAVRLLSADSYVRLAAGAIAGGLALAAVGAHSLIHWRRERLFVARELRELLDRWHSYVMGTFATDSEQRQELARYVVAAWLAGIIVNLLLLGDHFDVALRDFGLLLAALALARLATGRAPATAGAEGR